MWDKDKFHQIKDSIMKNYAEDKIICSTSCNIQTVKNVKVSEKKAQQFKVKHLAEILCYFNLQSQIVNQWYLAVNHPSDLLLRIFI